MGGGGEGGFGIESEFSDRIGPIGQAKQQIGDSWTSDLKVKLLLYAEITQCISCHLGNVELISPSNGQFTNFTKLKSIVFILIGRWSSVVHYSQSVLNGSMYKLHTFCGKIRISENAIRIHIIDSGSSLADPVKFWRISLKHIVKLDTITVDVFGY
jgi:hypothetical protein